MNPHSPITCGLHGRVRPLIALSISVLALANSACQTQPQATEHAANPALRPIEVAPGASPTDADRAALARFVGVWNFEGWCDQEGQRNSATGRAAGAIENDHFVMLDLQVTSGQMAGRAGGKGGSMIFASEPGIGPTLTAWGSAAPSIARFVGRVEGNGSAFSFKEARTPEGRHRLSMLITFETDDSWTVEIRDDSISGSPVVGSYRFMRAG